MACACSLCSRLVCQIPKNIFIKILSIVYNTFLKVFYAKYFMNVQATCSGFSLKYPQGVVKVGIVATLGIVGIVGIEFFRPEPLTNHPYPSILLDISCCSYLKEQKSKNTHSASPSLKIIFLCLLFNW